MRLPLGIWVATLVPGCLGLNPEYDETAGAAASSTGGGSSTSTSAGAGATTTTTATPTTTGDEGSATAGESTTSGWLSSTTGSGGQVDTDTSTGPPDMPPGCPGSEVLLTLKPQRDAFFITHTGAQCPWTDSNLVVMNNTLPCAVQNYGTTVYATIGATAEGRAEYVVEFGVFEAMQAQPGMTLVSATLSVVPWWAQDRDGIALDVGLVAGSDVWVEGGKNAGGAGPNDSSWNARWIDESNTMHPWQSGQGPAAGSLGVGSIEVGHLLADSHEYRTSPPIDGAFMASWVTSAQAEQGLVLSTSAPPVLVKSKDAGADWVPVLTLTLCPNGGG